MQNEIGEAAQGDLPIAELRPLFIDVNNDLAGFVDAAGEPLTDASGLVGGETHESGDREASGHTRVDLVHVLTARPAGAGE